jgi:hypothetical protein
MTGRQDKKERPRLAPAAAALAGFPGAALAARPK